jgi:hypothetical protein
MALKEIVMPEQTKYWRNIAELSPLNNNDEVVWFSLSEVDYKEFYEKAKEDATHHWCNPTLVISRPVFEEEIKDGLSIHSNVKSLEFSEQPEITNTLDGLYKLLVSLQNKLRYDKTIGNAINDTIAYEYYDCMSTGMRIPAIIACRILIKQYSVDLSLETYPNGDQWYTLKDWMEETQIFKDGEQNMLSYMNPKLLGE